MPKFLFTVLLAIACTGAFAQDLKEVQEKISKGRYDEAKEKIDKFLADPANRSTANAWYYKGKVYKELARDDSAGTLTFDAGKEAFDAFRKYQELDKKNVMMAVDQNLELFQLYDIFYNRGVKYYNDASYDTAFNKMKTALELEEYIVKHGFSYKEFSFPSLDSNLLHLTASAAWLAKKQDQAIPYWEKLANARIKTKDLKDVYGLLSSYYAKKNDQQKALKYLTIGKELYPEQEDLWISLEYDLTNPGTDPSKRFARYEQMLQKYPGNYAQTMDYAIEQFNFTYSKEKRPSDYISRQEKLQGSLEKAISIKPTAIGNFVMSQHIFYQVYDLEDALRSVKGTSQADIAKKKDLATKISEKYELFYPYALKSYELYTAEPELKSQDKANLRKLVGQLADYFDKKNDGEKADFYREKLKNIN
ncbi:MAG: hypothetical protein ACJ749_05030 [Flavisolibacter sp.]